MQKTLDGGEVMRQVGYENVPLARAGKQERVVFPLSHRLKTQRNGGPDHLSPDPGSVTN